VPIACADDVAFKSAPLVVVFLRRSDAGRGRQEELLLPLCFSGADSLTVSLGASLARRS
jgi:hypothetical protein